MERKKYNTKNRTMILDYLKEHQDTSVSAQDITNFLKSQEILLNRSTVYRYLNQLCEDDQIIKYVDNNEGKTVFKYIEEQHNCLSHIHLKCVVCNKIIHLECGFMNEMKEHLEEEHRFSLQCEGSVLYGICDECKQQQPKHMK